MTVMALTSCSLSTGNQAKNNDGVANGESFEIKRGVNISHWLSQSSRRGEQREQYITEADIRNIASYGYDHIRFPFDEEHLWDESGAKDSSGFALLHQGIRWALEHGLKVVADLHIVRSHYFNASYNPLWEEKAERERFLEMWEQLSEELRAYPVEEVAYEILNEPVADNPAHWNELVLETVKVIREQEPQRTIVIGSNRWNSVNTFNDLEIPENDKHLILSFHFYAPHVFTHYQAPWSKKVGFYTGPVHYPGHAIHKEDLQGYDAAQIASLTGDDGDYGSELFMKRIQEAVDYANEKGLRLYCGEFGAYPTTVEADRLQWYADIRSVFEAQNIAWANWDYKGGFGVVDGQTGEPRQKLLDVLLKDVE